MSTNTVKFDGRLVVTIVAQFDGAITIALGSAIVTREIYGRVFQNNAAFPEERLVRAVTASGTNYTAQSGNTRLEGNETWYRLFAAGTEDTQIVINAQFNEFDGSNFAGWTSTFPAGTISRTSELMLGSMRTLAAVDTSGVGIAPPTLYFEQVFTVGTELQPNTVYTAIVWCRAGAGSQGQIVVVNNGSPIIGTNNSIEEFKKLQVQFITGSVSETVQLQLQLTIGSLVDFTLVNIIEGTQVGFEEGEQVFLQVQTSVPSVYLKGEDIEGEDISFAFLAGSAFDDTGITNLDLYFNAPTTAVNIPGGIFDIRPTIEFFVTSNIEEEVTIKYSVNGGSLNTYIEPFVFAQDGTNILRWYGVDSQGNTEEEHRETYQINAPQVVATPISGTYGSVQNILFDTKGRDGTIFYEFEGIIPGFHSTQYDPLNPIVVSTGTTILKYFFQDEFGTVTAVQTAKYVIDTTRPIIESFSINNGAAITNSAIVDLALQLDGDIEIDRLQFAVGTSDLTLEELNSGAFPEEVQALFTNALFLQPRENIRFDLLYQQIYFPNVATIILYGRAFTADPNSASEFSPIVAQSIILDRSAPFFTVDSIVDRNGDTLDIVSTYNAFSLQGRKNAEAKIIAIVDGIEQLLVNNVIANTAWQAQLILSLGYHTIAIVAESNLGTRSVAVEYVTTIVVPPGLTDATALVDESGNWSIPFMFFDKSQKAIPYHTFRISASTNIGLEPTVDSIAEQELIGENIVTIFGTAPAGAIVTVNIDRIR